MIYTKEEREQIKQSINPIDFTIIEKSYTHFVEWFNDDNIEDNIKDILINQLILTATPSILYPQYIRLEIIAYWKERFIDYPLVVELLENIH